MGLMSFTRSCSQKPRIAPITCQLRPHDPSPQDVDDSLIEIPHLETKRRLKFTEIVGLLYQWTTCLFISFLVLAQLFGSVWNTTTTVRHIDFGRDPELDPFQVVGTNDLPFADRVIACVRYGRTFEPRLVSSLLGEDGSEATLEDSTGVSRHGFRLVQRRAGSRPAELDSTAYTSYCKICSLISSTLDNIFEACSALGYTNFTTENLRVVEGVDSNRFFSLPGSLPVLIMPFWDNAEHGRHALPTLDGDACLFRLGGAYFGTANGATNTTKADFRGVNRTIRHDRTLQWLKKPGGVWKNGWYEDLDGGRWFSDVASSHPGPPFNMTYRMFDMLTGLEANCSRQEDCITPTLDRWGTKFLTYQYPRDYDSIAVLNGSFFGHFLYNSNQASTVHIVYDWETLVSNLSVGLVLMRWMVTLVAIHLGSVRGEIPCVGGGIGCVANYRNFDLLLVSMLPQLKMTLTAFWTVGCRFEGQQAGLSEAWFTIYPAIVQMMLMYFSLLNALAKLTRRRMSDTLFGPTVAFLCLIHFFRSDLAASPLLNDVDGRVATVVFSDEVKNIKLLDYFVSDLAWRINGRVTVLFSTKLAVLAINLLPLLAAQPFPISKRRSRPNLCGIESALALRAAHVGGLGVSAIYLSTLRDTTEKSSGRNKTIIAPPKAQCERKELGSQSLVKFEPVVYLNSYELVRLGYVVFGDRYLISLDDWDLLSSMAPLRALYHLWNQRICVWTLEFACKITGLRSLRKIEPEIWRLDDKRLQNISWWQMSSCAVQC